LVRGTNPGFAARILRRPSKRRRRRVNDRNAAAERAEVAVPPDVVRRATGFAASAAFRIIQGAISPFRMSAMEIDTGRIDSAVLALLLLGRHDGCRVWKSFDWDAMNRLYEKGYITDPVSKAKSVVLTEEGEREAERLFQEMFAAKR
jgi:hypothetical protein